MTKGGKADKWAARSARLSVALRENLKRRKEQAREREKSRQPAGEAHGSGPEPAGDTGQGMRKEAAPHSPQPDAEMPASPEFRRNQVRE